jgi:hypothetical protein
MKMTGQQNRAEGKKTEAGEEMLAAPKYIKEQWVLSGIPRSARNRNAYCGWGY